MLSTLPNLDGLIGLGHQDGVDVRPTLLRVLTDLYVQKPTHTREEEHRFTELALSLLAGVDVAARTAVARKLAAYTAAPHAVILRLARDVIEVAEPILKASACLGSDELLAIIKDLGPRYAEAIAARTGGGPAGADTRPTQAPAMPQKSSEPGNEQQEVAAPPVSRSEPVFMGDDFLNAEPAERRALLGKLEDAGAPAHVPLAIADTSIAELESAALERRPDDFVSGLTRILKISDERAQRIVADVTGEPVIVAAKAIAMPPDVLLRILLFLNPAIGQSVERVFSLVDLYDQVSRSAALRVVASWQNRHSGGQRHQSLHWDDERRSARRTFGEHTRRFPLQVPDDRPQSTPRALLHTRG